MLTCNLILSVVNHMQWTTTISLQKRTTDSKSIHLEKGSDYTNLTCILEAHLITGAEHIRTDHFEWEISFALGVVYDWH